MTGVKLRKSHNCRRIRRADEPACRPGSVTGTLRSQRATIHLRLPLPTASSGLPAGSGGPPSNAYAAPSNRSPSAPFDLAPGGVYRAARVASRAGGLLHHRFTLTSPDAEQVGVRESGLFSVALSRGSPRVGVTHHLALWSPDLPRHAPEGAQRGRPADSSAVVATVDGQGAANSNVRVTGSASAIRTSRRSPSRNGSPS